MRERFMGPAVAAFAVVGLDQLTKALAVNLLAAGPVEVIPGLFRLALVHNRGAAFGALSWLPHAPWFFLCTTIIAVAASLWLLLGSAGRSRPVRLCLGLVMGGALGNMADRLRLGEVVDFINLHAGAYHWPTFNVADMGITCGGLYLAWLLVRGKA